MPKFLYKAKNSNGEIVTGTVTTYSQPEAERILVKHNLVSMEIMQEQSSVINSFFTRKLSVKDRSIIARQLATMLSAGLPLSKAVSILAKQARTETIQKIFLEIYKDLEEGYSFSACLSKHPEAFDKVFVSIVASGESTGKLDIVLNELANQLERDSSFTSKVVSSLYYPGFILVAMFGGGFFMLTFIVPKLKTMFDGAGQQLPAITRMLLGLSGFMVSWWWLVLIVVIGGIIFLRFWFETEAGAVFLYQMEMTIPGIRNVVEGLYMYRFTRITAMLISSGVPLLDTLKISASVIGNVTYEESIMRISKQVEKGVPLSAQILKEPKFPQLVGNMIAVGEETGELDKVLSKVADYYEESTNDATKAIQSLVEPVVMVLIGVAVAILVFAIYIPIYQINSTVGG